MKDLLRAKLLAITSIFEDSTPQPQYGYCETLGDGRGYTFGYCGFTSATGDGPEVVSEAIARSRAAADLLVPYAERFRELAQTREDSILGLEGFQRVWEQIGTLPGVIAAQHFIGHALYYAPALDQARILGWKSPLAQACLYDAIIQHGKDGDYPDSLVNMLSRCPELQPEKIGLLNFLKLRQETLEHASDISTRDQWASSVARVEALRNLIENANWKLDLPIQIRSSDFNYDITDAELFYLWKLDHHT